jgi:hypothetical protein
LLSFSFLFALEPPDTGGSLFMPGKRPGAGAKNFEKIGIFEQIMLDIMDLL